MNAIWVGLAVGVFTIGLSAITLLVVLRLHSVRNSTALDEQRQGQLEKLAQEIKSDISETNFTVLGQMSEQLSLMAGEKVVAANAAVEKTLDQKKAVIDTELAAVNSSIEKLGQTVSELSRRSSQNFGNITSQLAATSASTLELSKTTGSLREMLSNSRARGQHGEFAAEGVLRAAGLVEGMHYQKQPRTVTGTRPDFSIKIDSQKEVSLDCKFPLDNLWRCFEAESETDGKKSEATFIKDVKNRIDEVVGRGYIGADTIDLVILFVSSEGVYSFLLERNPTIFEYAMRRKVVLAGPFTLFAVLSVIKQGTDNFIVEQKSQEILELMMSFKTQWEKFTDSLEQLGKKLTAANKAYDTLASTRRNQLDRSLNQIETLSDQAKITAIPIADDEVLAVTDEQHEKEEQQLEKDSHAM